MKPQFKHNCTKCTFVKRVLWGERKNADLYIHGNIENVDWNTGIVVRFSDEESDYASADLLHVYSPMYSDNPLRKIVFENFQPTKVKIVKNNELS